MEKISYLQALDHIRNVKPVYSKRMLPIEDACGWILAEPLFAKYNVPPAPCSAMDGFAVTAAETTKANERKYVTLTKFQRVNTSNPVVEPFDAVILIEDIVKFTETELTIREAIKKGKNVRATGEEVAKGRLILPAGAKLRAFDIGALAGYGYMKVPVKCVSVGIIPTGTELIKAGTIPKPGQVIESNSYMVEAYVKQFGVGVIRYPAVEDDQAKIKKALTKGLKENDIIIISAGSSMGSKDYTSSIISDIGKLVFHGVLMKPAETSMLGLVKGKPVIGMPRFPLAVATTLRMFVRPLLELWGFKGPARTKLTATAGSIVETDEEIDELRFGATAFVEGKPISLPEIRSASSQMNGIRANGYLHIPRGMRTTEPGNVIKAVADADPDELKATILIGGKYSQGMEPFVENAAEAGLVVRFGEGNPAELLANKYCHAACSEMKLKLNVPLETFLLCDGTYLIMRKDMNDSLCGSLRRFAGII